MAEIIWKVQFHETPDQAKQLHDKAVKDLADLQKESMFAQELPDEILEKKSRLTAACRQYLERSGLVHRVANIIFERQPRCAKSVRQELEVLPREEEEAILQKQQELNKALWADSWQRRKELVNYSRRIKNRPEELKDTIREKERVRKAEYRKKKPAGSTAI